MFGKISTKNLYVVKLAEVINKVYINEYTQDEKMRIFYCDNTTRFVLAKRKDNAPIDSYFDVFTQTVYTQNATYAMIGCDAVVLARAFTTNKKYITKKEAVEFLEKLNQAYLKKKDDAGPVLKKTKN